MENTRTDGFSHFLDEAERLLRAEPSAEQVIAVRTAKDSVLHLLNRSIMDGGTGDEDAFFAMLSDRGERAVRAVLCMWHDGTIDLPSIHFRRRLIELCPGNKDAAVLLQGEGTLITKKLEALM